MLRQKSTQLVKITHIIGVAFALLSLIHVLVYINPTHAQFHSPNNKVGVSLIEPSLEDIDDAFEMVGKGGWITIVEKEGDLTPEELQDIYDHVRQHEGILIERWATSGADENGNWHAPTQDTINYFIGLYQATNPPHKYRYIQLLNEHNHASENGGVCDPTASGKWMAQAAKAIKDAGIDSVVMLAATDVQAPESRPAFCNATSYHREMINNVPDLYDNVDALSHHCYASSPRKFSGSATTSGKDSVVCHDWEKSLIVSLVDQNDQISEETKEKVRNFRSFITETGWQVGPGGITEEAAASHMRTALGRWQEDPNVFAVTPFVFKYLTPPFDAFSLVEENNVRNLVGQMVEDSPKIDGRPIHLHKSTCFGSFPRDLAENVDYEIEIECLNKGTDIWKGIIGDFGEYEFELQTPFEYDCTTFHTIMPGGLLRITCTVNPGNTTGCPSMNVGMRRGGSLLMKMLEVQMCVHPAPPLTLTNAKNFPGLSIENAPVQVQVFRESDERLVAQIDAQIEQGVIAIEGVEGVNFDDRYRIVVLKEGSLPVQVVNVRFNQVSNEHDIPLFLAIDANADGKFSLTDILQGYQ